ncbi:hypothetical protein RS694_05310 [Rhodoferax saidenbachensis]|uniref:Uncharacterized protein n=1 Tax=Rhodoferax saidenbachensis TaxID=1484693 RepID=A0A1P8K7N2_9BURK|nr:hypothetical protein RS694_05310 [Rhodoferax saidenbachensis]
MLVAPAAALLTALLSGCAPKPPGCDDPQIVDRFRLGIADDGVKQISNNIEAAGNWRRAGANQLRAQLDAFGKSIKVEMVTITTNGYDADAKLHSCSANLMVATDGSPVQIERMPYSIQGTADGKDFVLSSPQYQLVVAGIMGAFDVYQSKARRAANSGQAPVEEAK